MECSLCSKQFTRSNNLRRHMLKIHGHQDVNENISQDKNFSCSTCDARFTEKRNLNRHLLNTHNINQSQIDKQRKMEEKQMKKDETTRKNEQTTSAKQKPKTKKPVKITPFDLTMHENNGRFYCAICDRPFVTAEARNKHFIQSHQTERPYECEKCSKRFRSAVNKCKHEQYCQGTATNSSDTSNSSLTQDNNDLNAQTISQGSTMCLSPPVVHIDDIVTSIDTQDDDNDSYTLSLSQISTPPSSPASIQIGSGFVLPSPTANNDDNDDEDMQLHRSGPNDVFHIYRKNFSPSSENLMDRLQDGVNEAQHQTRLHQESNNPCKIYISAQISFYKASNVDQITSPHPTFNSDIAVVLPTTTLTPIMKTLKDNLIHQLDSYERNGSGWVMNNIVYLDLHIVQFDPLRASSFLPMPKKFVNKKGYVNIENKDLKRH